MSSLYRKYRPAKFEQISGQEHIVKTLSRSIAKNRIGHAYLFSGSRGTGKTSLARIFAKAVNCLSPIIDQEKLAVLEPCDQCEACRKINSGKNLDILEIDAASNTGVDNIRQLKENVNTPPAFLKYKLYIIDEVHMLSTGAFNALLKTLEEPPVHAIFILATTENHKIPETIASRCQRFDFFQLTNDQIVLRLEQLAKKEKVAVEKEALEMIATEAEGGMRDAESLLGQIISLEDEKITIEETEKILGIASGKSLSEFAEKVILEKNTPAALTLLDNLTKRGVNPKNFEKSFFLFLRQLLILTTNPEISLEKNFQLSQNQKEALKKIAQNSTVIEIIRLLDLLGKNYSLHKSSPLPQLPLELSLIEFTLEQNSSELKKSSATTSSTKEKTINLPPEKEKKSISEISQTKKEAPQENLPTNPKTEEKKSNKLEEKNLPSIQEFLRQWPQILEAAKPFNHSIHAFLKNCIPHSIENGKIIIKTRYEYHCTKLNQPECRLTVQSSIAKLFPEGLKAEFVFDKNLPLAEKAEKESSPASPNPAEEETEEDLLFETMRDLGGQIVEEKE